MLRCTTWLCTPAAAWCFVALKAAAGVFFTARPHVLSSNCYNTHREPRLLLATDSSRGLLALSSTQARQCEMHAMNLM